MSRSKKPARSTKTFMDQVTQQAPFKVPTLLTDSHYCQGRREPTGEHLLDKLCAEQQIDHRSIPIKRPLTIAMVGRFTPRVAATVESVKSVY